MTRGRANSLEPAVKEATTSVRPNRLKRTCTWLVLTFALSWTMAFGYFALGGKPLSLSWLLMGVFCMFTPALSTLATELLFKSDGALERLGISFRPNWWFAAGLLAPALLALISTGVSLVQRGVFLTAKIQESNFLIYFPLQRLPPMPAVHPFWMVLIAGTFAGLTVNGVVAFGEELGWRGFLPSEWKALGFWRSSWLIGAIWGLWHLPAVLHGWNYPGHPFDGILMMIIWTTLFSPVIGYVRLRSRSVLAAALMHGALNGTAIAPQLVLRGGDSLTTGMMGWPGMAVLALLNLGVLWLNRTAQAHPLDLAPTQTL